MILCRWDVTTLSKDLVALHRYTARVGPILSSLAHFQLSLVIIIVVMSSCLWLWIYDCRLTTYEVLAQLPPPEETAQALVIKGAESEGGATHKRRESISHFFRRKFSRKKDCEFNNCSGPALSRKFKLMTPWGAFIMTCTTQCNDPDYGRK